MNARRLEVLEITNPTDRLRCYVTERGDGAPHVKARLLREGQVIEENEFLFDPALSRRELRAMLEEAMRDIAARAGGRLRILSEAERHGRGSRRHPA